MQIGLEGSDQVETLDMIRDVAENVLPGLREREAAMGAIGEPKREIHIPVTEPAAPIAVPEPEPSPAVPAAPGPAPEPVGA